MVAAGTTGPTPPVGTTWAYMYLSIFYLVIFITEIGQNARNLCCYERNGQAELIMRISILCRADIIVFCLLPDNPLGSWKGLLSHAAGHDINKSGLVSIGAGAGVNSEAADSVAKQRIIGAKKPIKPMTKKLRPKAIIARMLLMPIRYCLEGLYLEPVGP